MKATGASKARLAQGRWRRVSMWAGAPVLAVLLAGCPAVSTTHAQSNGAAASRAAQLPAANVPTTTSTAPLITTSTAPAPVPAPVMTITCPTVGGASPAFGHDITATSPYTVAIDYGDGDRYSNDSQHLDAVFTHTYQSAGTFTVSAVVTDYFGQQAMSTCVYAWAPLAAAQPAPAPAGGDTYTNVDGNQVPGPVSADSPPAGATARCNDGTYSFSQHRQGTCSHHGGVAQWL